MVMIKVSTILETKTGITREPQFTSKRRLPSYPPQVSTSLQFEQHNRAAVRPVSPPVVSSEERRVTPLAPRDPVPAEGTTSPSIKPQRETTSAQRRKAGLNMENQRSSEYQRQFMWKTPVAESPLLAAQEMLYNSNSGIPPFKTNPVIMESEYKRSFKGSPPPRPPRLRRDIEEHEIPHVHEEKKANEKSKRKKKQHRRKSSPIEESTNRQQEVKSPCHTSPKVLRKLKTEYRANFRSPVQYSYRDGAWVKIKEEVGLKYAYLSKSPQNNM
ncbi:hypothetical protein DNTS_030079 [Danionella cerebrum]|uniref:Nuclear protein MDM1 n=1 Tax=Danionella cerebrum TaxID=2873325 RepID=A0A553QSQ2_9TELE|nr:hypothetical protein DNTS_030079 [Danionella translucida]